MLEKSPPTVGAARPAPAPTKYKKSTKGIPSLGGEHLNSEGNFNFHKLKFVPLKFFESMSKGHVKFEVLLQVVFSLRSFQLEYTLLLRAEYQGNLLPYISFLIRTFYFLHL